MDQRMEIAVDQAFEAELAALERCLRQAVDDDAWHIYLQLDQVRARHHAMVVDLVANAAACRATPSPRPSTGLRPN